MEGNLHIDFETRSTVDLVAEGIDKYAVHPNTSVLCFAYGWDEGEVKLWKRGQPIPNEIITHIKNSNIVEAHNVTFEILIWNAKIAPLCGVSIDYRLTDCTMAKAYTMALPGSLDGASMAVGLEQKKDMDGKRIMLQLCKPRRVTSSGKPIWYEETDSPEKYEVLYKYCIQDVIVERELAKRLRALSPYEKKVWQLDYEINRRGVQIDMDCAVKSLELIDHAKDRLDKEMIALTDFKVSSCNSSKQIKDFLKLHNVDMESISKQNIIDFLNQDDLEPIVRKVLELRLESAKSSTAKIKAMMNGAKGGRIRGLFQYHGANTGRWSGRRVQLQNLPRPNMSQDNIEKAIELISQGVSAEYIDIFYGSTLQVCSDIIRGLLIASPSKKLLAADYSAIEARVLAWLAGEEKTLEVFRTHGKIYEKAAGDIYNVSLDNVDKEQRQIGKVAVLALGYQGGVGAFQSMASVYGVKVSDERADEIKINWRNSNQATVGYWYSLERSAKAAIEYKGQQFKAGSPGREVTFLMKGSFLMCQLPSKRILYYPYAKLEDITNKWGTKQGITYMGEDSITGKWSKQNTYGGKLAENITQAVSRDLLANAMLMLDDNGYEIIMHVHDEIVTEVSADKSLKSMEEIMTTNPQWAEGLPITAEGWEGARFRK